MLWPAEYVTSSRRVLTNGHLIAYLLMSVAGARCRARICAAVSPFTTRPELSPSSGADYARLFAAEVSSDDLSAISSCQPAAEVPPVAADWVIGDSERHDIYFSPASDDAVSYARLLMPLFYGFGADSPRDVGEAPRRFGQGAHYHHDWRTSASRLAPPQPLPCD